jgi:competence ComEA-like helix-hairpin-helix protein
MLKKSSFVSLKNFYLMPFALLISAAFILGMGATPAQAAKKADTQKNVAAVVDINSATQKELEDVKDIGPAKAKKIIAGRPYKSVDELSKAGLKPKAIDAIKPFVTVGKVQVAPVTAVATKATVPVSAAATKAAADVTNATKDVKEKAKSKSAAKLALGTKININTADQTAIEKLPEIGPVKAKAIIDGRPYKSIEDVMKVKGIKGKTFDAIKDFIVVN